jgi:hypothetical protein
MPSPVVSHGEFSADKPKLPVLQHAIAVEQQCLADIPQYAA